MAGYKRGMFFVLAAVLFVLSAGCSVQDYTPGTPGLGVDSGSFYDTEGSEKDLAIYRFNNLTTEDFLYDFNYLMQALEENWPFFNISVSTRGIDVRELADDVRNMLDSPSVVIGDALAFADLLDVHFLQPIGHLGHLSSPWPYDEFFRTLEWAELVMGGYEASLRELELAGWPVERVERAKTILGTLSRPEAILFHEVLRDVSGSVVSSADSLQQEEFGFSRSVVETAIIEDGEIAHLTVRFMLDTTMDEGLVSGLAGDPAMGHYEEIIYDFYREIADFDHLIIDLRGNPGGMTSHFDVFVLAPLLTEQLFLPAYLFYTDGVYSKMARTDPVNLADIGAFGSVEPTEAVFTQPLPYLDASIDFVYAFSRPIRFTLRVSSPDSLRRFGMRSCMTGKYGF
ncbi:MAG: S41 family peptidase [Oscillospiraceae bacterium]|nr:S41 family peptidase [Oscillospiraceae bacterium]